jgi:aromatic-L-amino-acid/L-tryptophan decarboxylase
VSERFDWHPDAATIDLTDGRAREALEQLGDATLRAALEWLFETAMERPVRGDTYPEARSRFYGSEPGPSSAPAEPANWASVLDEFKTRIGPGTFNAQHPGSFSYFTPPPLPSSVAGEVLAQWINQGVDIFDAGPVGAFVEEEVIAWLRDLVGFGPQGWGVLTSGGVMANIMAMAVARDVHLTKLRGLVDPPRGADLEGVTVYASDQTHFSVARGLDMLGFPERALRILPSDDRFRLRGADVAAAVAKDRAEGLLPLAIAAVAGSTNTGSVDPVGELADVAQSEGMWLHVDAAYGGAVRLSDRDGRRVADLDRADSVTIDPHKWFFQAYDIGALMVRERQHLLDTFHREPEYYKSARDEEPLNWYQYSMEGTRRFRALKLWMSWKHMGTQGFGHLIEDNIDLAAYLAERCRDLPNFEALPPEPELSVVCFRHLPRGNESMEPAELDAYQSAMQRALELSGAAWVSVTTLRGRRYMRAGIVNYLSTRADVDRMLKTLEDQSESVLEHLNG